MVDPLTLSGLHGFLVPYGFIVSCCLFLAILPLPRGLRVGGLEENAWFAYVRFRFRGGGVSYTLAFLTEEDERPCCSTLHSPCLLALVAEDHTIHTSYISAVLQISGQISF